MNKHNARRRTASILFSIFFSVLVLLSLTVSIKAEDEVPGNGIPVVYIDIDESQGTVDEMIASPDHSVYCYGTISIDVPEGFHYADYPDLDLKDYENLKMSIRGRGNSTWNASDKKPFKIKLDKKEDIFGFGKNKHWVLLANAFDPSLIRNRITFRLSEALGFEFTPQAVPVDVVLRGDQYGTKYLGSYTLGENIRIDENRLDIGELEEDETDPSRITGGYLIQNALQVEEGSANRFNTPRGESWANDTPSFEPRDGGYENDAQKNYIRDHLNMVEDAIYEGSDEYKELMDVKSAASYWLINTLAMNLDAYKTSSTYIYKKPDVNGVTGKVYWGPVWDYDYAWDQGEVFEGMSAAHIWMKPLFADDSEGGFLEEVRKQWPLLRQEAENIIADGGLIDQYYEETKQSAERDHEINPPRQEESEYSYQEKTEKLKTWIRNRLAWLDENIGSVDQLVHTVTFTVDGEVFRKEYCEAGQSVLFVFEQPEKEGYIFKGWQDEEGNIYQFEVSTEQDLTLSAKFIPESEAVKASDIVFAKNSDVFRFNPENNVYLMDWVVLPYDAYDKWVDWSVSDESIASVTEDGQVNIHTPGTVIITATTRNGISRDFTLVITEDELPLPEKIVPDQEVIRMRTGESARIVMTPEPALAKVNEYSYESENPDIADVDFYGIVSAQTEGTVRIHVTSSTYIPDDSWQLDAWVTVIVSDAQPAEYTVVSGKDAEWTKGSKEGITVTVKRSEDDENCFARFLETKLDGNVLKKDTDYTAKAGSTVITLKPAYLETLKEGEHTLTVVFDDGSAETKLTIRKASPAPVKPSAPDTSDSSSRGLWAGALLVSLLAAAFCFRQLRRA